jgi:hypothetical protein
MTLRRPSGIARRLLWALAVVWSLPFLLWLAYLLFVKATTTSLWWPRQPFSEEAWKRSSRGERYLFSKELLDLLEGRSETSVVELLGQPDTQGSDYAGKYLAYVIRAESALGLDYEQLLIIEFDHKGMVRHCRFALAD